MYWNSVSFDNPYFDSVWRYSTHIFCRYVFLLVDFQILFIPSRKFPKIKIGLYLSSIKHPFGKRAEQLKPALKLKFAENNDPTVTFFKKK